MIRRYSTRAVFLFESLVVAVFGYAGPAAATTPFVHEPVDFNLVRYTSLALDSKGVPHISYFDVSSTDLIYATRSGGIWFSERVDETIPDLGRYSSIALDALGNPHISYYDNTNDNLKYATKSGGVWTIETVDAAGDVGAFSSIAVEANGTPHISYYDRTGLDLLYATKPGGVWAFEDADNGAILDGVGQFSSIALDSHGIPHISYLLREVLNEGELRFARRTDGTWVSEVVDNPALVDVGLYTSLALDAQGNPHISYFDNTNDDLKYAHKTTGSWTKEIVDATGSVGLDTSIRIDAQGNPHISYWDQSNQDLKYASKSGASWTIETIQTEGVVGEYTSLALDAQGNPHISYSWATAGRLNYADAAIRIVDPVGGETWPVGATRLVSWHGAGAVDLYLSTDGGNSFNLLKQSITGGNDPTRGTYSMLVPHQPSRFCVLRLERPFPMSTAETESLLTIQASITLLSLRVSRAQSSPGNLITWATNPGIEDLGGYRIEKASGEGQWKSLVDQTRETRYEDASGAAQDRYRLFAINGLGTEYLVGEASNARTPAVGPALSVWPVPYRGGDALTIEFAMFGRLGDASADIDVAIYDVSGKLVRRVTRGRYPPGMHRVTWNGHDSAGRTVASGVYFVHAISGGVRSTRKVVVVR